MQSFKIQVGSDQGIIPMDVKQTASITADDLIEFEVTYHDKENELHSLLTLDVSRWYPPMVLSEAKSCAHQPEVFVFCHDGQFNYRQAHAIGEAIIRYLDREADDAAINGPDLFKSAD